VGRILEELGCVGFEEPVQHYHTDSFAKLATALDIAVAAGEQEYTLQGIKRLIEAGVKCALEFVHARLGLPDLAAWHGG
jgi:L-alanine-DL-glutamate epimerase-like enolase superfamily enzyme